ncbi:hypothetical protein JCM10213_008722 [Rhodosporidiobolus nylandii]
MPSALLVPVRSTHRGHSPCASKPFAQLAAQKTVSYPQFIRQIELFAQEEAEEVALQRVEGRRGKRVRLEERIEGLLLELKGAVISFALPPFSCRSTPPRSPDILRPSLPSISRRVQTLYGVASISPSSFSLPPSALIRLNGVSGMCYDLGDDKTPLGKMARAMSRETAGRLLLETQDLVLRPRVRVLEMGGYRVTFELASGAFHPLAEEEMEGLRVPEEKGTRAKW